MAGLSAKRGYERTDYARRVAAVARVCRRMEGGENLTEICRDPTMPPRTTMASWLERHDELRAQVEAVQAAFPELHARRAYHTWSDEVAQEFLGRIVDGRGLREVCAERDMPVHSSVTRWLNERPAFAQAYRQAREAQADTLFDLAWRIACDVGEAPAAGEVAAARLKINTLKWRVGRLAPKKYGPWKAVADAAEAGPAAAWGPAQVETREFARTPQKEVLDITRHVRGMNREEMAAFRARIAAGWTPPDLGPLAADEHIEGVFLVRQGRAAG